MAAKTFAGGGHIPEYKDYTEAISITRMSLPKEVVIPLVQHIGAPCEPLVQAGDRVTLGQKIGDCDGFVSAPVHSSVDGIVLVIEPRLHCAGHLVPSVVISVDESQSEFDTGHPRDLDNVSKEEILTAIREAGIVGMGGAGFPTRVKLSPPKPVDTIIVNGAECEPFLTADHRSMLEITDKLLYGLRAAMKATGATKGVIAVEDNKPDAIAKLQQSVSSDSAIDVVALQTKYPQGGEKQIIFAVCGRTVPSGGLPMDIGVVVQNVGTCIAIANAVMFGMPLIERVVTVAGPKVPQGGNFMIRLGTPTSYVLKECGVENLEGQRLIIGGPMTGVGQDGSSAPVIKITTGILVLPDNMLHTDTKHSGCVRCAQCVEQCPMNLYPNKLSQLIEFGRLRETLEWDISDCIECGLCSYVCPAKRPIVKFIKETKPVVKTAARV